MGAARAVAVTGLVLCGDGFDWGGPGEPDERQI
jgi:hypothetical protein